MLEIEEGREVFIPLELSQDRLPWSFRYYDPVMRYIIANCSRVQRGCFKLEYKLNLARIKDENLKLRLMAEFDGNSKLAFKHSVVNEKERNEINVLESQHTMALQRSKYVVVENDLERLKM